MNRPTAIATAAALLLLGACRDARQDARDELTRLSAEMKRHAGSFGRYPDTLDAARPADAANLAFRPEHGVEVRLLQSGRDGYQAVARRSSWVCWMMAGPGDTVRTQCAPVGSATRAASVAAGLPVDPPPTVLHSPPVPRADSDSAAAKQ